VRIIVHNCDCGTFHYLVEFSAINKLNTVICMVGKSLAHDVSDFMTGYRYIITCQTLTNSILCPTIWFVWAFS